MSFVNSVRAAVESGRTLAEIVDELQALASDPNANPDEAAKAKEMLRVMKDDTTRTDKARNLAGAAYRRVQERAAMNARMGVGRAVRDGRFGTFPLLTSDAARAVIAKKAAR